MADTAVLYKSKYGSTKKYAEWIAADLNADIYKASRISVRKLKTYSTIIFGGAVYMNKVIGINAAIRKFNALGRDNGRKKILFTCGLTNPAIEENRKRILDGINGRLPGGLPEGVRVFHLHGGIVHAELSRFHRFMMRMLENTLKGKREEDLSEIEKKMAETVGKDFDFTDRLSVRPIVEYALSGGE
jgi:menaquinone-dependent protoporphyrinogen IX oxidase